MWDSRWDDVASQEEGERAREGAEKGEVCVVAQVTAAAVSAIGTIRGFRPSPTEVRCEYHNVLEERVGF